MDHPGGRSFRQRSFSVFTIKTPESQGHNGGGSSWKFWRRLSFRSRGREAGRSRTNKDSSDFGSLSKADPGEGLAVSESSRASSPCRPIHGSRGLPDVLERVHALPVYSTNAVPPPKPPRLFLSRSQSNGGSRSSSNESVADGNKKDKTKTSSEDSGDVSPTYANCQRVNSLRSQLLKGDLAQDGKPSPQAGENNNVVGKLPLSHVAEEESESDLPALKNTELQAKTQQQASELKDGQTQSKTAAPSSIQSNCVPGVTNHSTSSTAMASPPSTTSGSSSSSPPMSSSSQPPSSSSPPVVRAPNSPYQQYHSSTTPRKQKIVTPELSHKRYGRSRRKSSADKNGGPVSRQRLIMNSLMDLMCQRLDPYPLLDPLKRAGVLTNVHLQSFLGHRDRKSVCESLADVIGKAGPKSLSVFCAVMASCPGNCTEILEILQVMREVDRIIHDIPKDTSTSQDATTDTIDMEAAAATSMVEENHLNFDIGYLSTDYSLKPLVELDRVRSNTGDTGSLGKRLSNASSRNSSYSLLESSTGCSATLGPGAGAGGSPGGGMAAGHPWDDVVSYSGLIMMSISITGHSLAGERSEALAEVIRNHNCISELHLGKTHLSGHDVIRLTQALSDKSSTIHSLDLRLNTIDSTGAEAVSKLLRHSRFLRVLNLSSTELDSRSFRQIVGAVSGSKSLVELDASFLDLPDECCSGLRDMLRANSTLQKLRLRGNNLTCAGCRTLCEGLARNIGLTSLDLSRNPIGDSGLQALAQYLPDSRVSEVSVDGCGISQLSGQALSELVSDCKRLKHLDVSTNSLGDAGVLRLAPALERSSSLMSVSMNMCSVSNDGFHKLLDALEKNTSIQGLKLCYNKLGEEHTNPAATSENLRYRLRIVMSSKPKLKILLWGNKFEES